MDVTHLFVETYAYMPPTQLLGDLTEDDTSTSGSVGSSLGFGARPWPMRSPTWRCTTHIISGRS